MMIYEVDESTNDMLFDTIQHLIILKRFYKNSNDPVGARMVTELIQKLEQTFEVQ